MNFDLSSEQTAAVAMIDRWLCDPNRPEFKLGGYAGTGKTTVIKAISAAHPGAHVMAFTGRAVSVLRSKGVQHASTVHGAIYRVTNAPGNLADAPEFERKHDAHARLAIVDEASMVGATLRRDILAFADKALWVGDPGQLPPVTSDVHLMKSPDFTLQQIHRQADDSGIAGFAGHLRAGHEPDIMQDRGVTVAHRNGLWAALDAMPPQTQIICGFNRTRQFINEKMRKRLGHFGPPVVGDRMVCLRNNKDVGVFNGELFDIIDVWDGGDEGTAYDIQTNSGTNHFGLQLDATPNGSGLYCDFGYALTAHKSQGGEWDDVAVVEELFGEWDAPRWRYTAATRARRNLLYLI